MCLLEFKCTEIQKLPSQAIPETCISVRHPRCDVISVRSLMFDITVTSHYCDKKVSIEELVIVASSPVTGLCIDNVTIGQHLFTF